MSMKRKSEPGRNPVRIPAILVSALCLLSVVGLGTALAATTPGGVWYQNGKAIQGSSPVTCEIGYLGSAKQINMSVALSSQRLKLVATGFSCPNSTIYNEAGSAKFSGELSFENVTVAEPAGCQVLGPIRTTVMKGEDLREGTTTFLNVRPKTPTYWTTIRLTGCSFAGSYEVRGSDLWQASSSLGSESPAQSYTFSPTINAKVGDTLSYGAEPLYLEGQVLVRDGGSSFGLREK